MWKDSERTHSHSCQWTIPCCYLLSDQFEVLTEKLCSKKMWCGTLQNYNLKRGIYTHLSLERSTVFNISGIQGIMWGQCMGTLSLNLHDQSYYGSTIKHWISFEFMSMHWSHQSSKLEVLQMNEVVYSLLIHSLQNNDTNPSYLTLILWSYWWLSRLSALGLHPVIDEGRFRDWRSDTGLSSKSPAEEREEGL